MTIHSLPADTGVRWMLCGCASRDGAVQQFDLEDFPFTIGRNRRCSLVLESGHVSSAHAEFVGGGQGLFIRDLGSTNGTFLNGRRLTADSPVASGDRIQFADTEFVIESSMATIPLAPTLGTLKRAGKMQEKWIFSLFEQLMRGGIYPVFQPIVVSGRPDSVHGTEALARSDVGGLERPDHMFATASRLQQEVPLSQLCRRVAILGCGRHIASDQRLFLNTHPQEDLFLDVLPSLMDLRERAPDQRIVIEIHEGAMTCVTQMRSFANELDALRIEFAYDDFGAGQTRLKEIVEVPPHYIKFDRCLIADLHTAPTAQRKIVQSLVETAHSGGSTAIAEGVELPETAEVCVDLGFDLIQGFLYGRPTR